MKTNFLLLILTTYFSMPVAFSNSCEGRGTVFFYGNGMFNATQKIAQENLDRLAKEMKPQGFVDQSKRTKFDLAYKTSEPILTQLKNVFIQKKIDNFETYWIWMDSLLEPPS